MSTKPTFLDLPAEIRCEIYACLLVWQEPIRFEGEYLFQELRAKRARWTGLYPAILLVCRQFFLEASPLLYCNNRFRFPGAGSWWSDSDDVHIPSVLVQMGAQASLIRHVCLEFPRFSQVAWYESGDRIELQSTDMTYLQRILNACTGVTTLEFSLHDTDSITHVYRVFNTSCKMKKDFEVEPLAILDAQLKAVTSLRNIVVSAETYQDDISDECDGCNGDIWKSKMHDYGWKVNVSIIERPRQMWTSSNDMVVFDNEEDYEAYEAELVRVQEEREQEEWLEEYYSR